MRRSISAGLRYSEVDMVRFLAKLFGVAIGVSIVAGIASLVAALNLRKKAPPRPAPDADEINLVSVMNGDEVASRATAFRGGRVLCWYAGVDLDLRDATLDPTGATLDVRTIFGGTRIVVAPGVPVRVGGPAIFGGKMNTTDAPEPTADAPGLEITGFTLFGGLQVIASERGEEIPGWTGERATARAPEQAEERIDAVLPAPALEVAPDVTPPAVESVAPGVAADASPA